MKEVINSILEAEKRADEITKAAVDKSNEILLIADEKAENLKIAAVNEIKETKKEILAAAEKKAGEEYDKIINEGKITARKLKDATVDKIDKSVDVVVRSILD